MRKKLTGGKDRELYWDADIRGLALQVTKRGHKSFVVSYRSHRVARRMLLQNCQTLDAARRAARVVLGKVAERQDPLAERRREELTRANTFFSVAQLYLKQEGPALRSLKARRRMLDRHIFPRLGKIPVDEIRRSDVAQLLADISENTGAPMAGQVLATLRKIMNWHACRSDSFRTPIVPGLLKGKPASRERTLTDDVIRSVWKAADELGTPFGRLTQYILLTGTRRCEASDLRRSEIDGNVWLIPASRYKTGKDHVIPLSRAAIEILDKLPKIGPGDFVFTTSGTRPISGFSRLKASFDEVCDVSNWTIHDLRRTSRTLMSRAKVPVDIAERCLGHTMETIRETYDRYSYLDEKRLAFESLASLIARIVDPQPNIVPLRAAE
jgi:hypothetical protein